MARKRRKRAYRGSGRRGRPGKLARVSTLDLRAELERRASAVTALARRRDEIRSELDDLEREIGALGAAPGSGRRGGRRRVGKRRGRRGGPSLADVLQQVLGGKTLSVIEATEAVKRAGYGSKSPNLRVMVNQQLISRKNSDRFRRVARGRYTSK